MTNISRQCLFLDWLNVYEAGGMEITLDPARISPQGRKMIDSNAKKWGIHVDTSGHGMKRSCVPFGVKVTIEKARKSHPWLHEDQPWEKCISSLTVIHEEGKYRCWYAVTFPKPLEAEKSAEQVFHEGRQMDMGMEGLCYAESSDGVNWVKPSIGLFSFNGSTDNNIVSNLQMGPGSVFRDPSAPPEERYKGFVWDTLPGRGSGWLGFGLYGAVSPDGLRWTRLPDPLIPEFCDTQNVVYWDEQKRRYVGYFRGGMCGRAIRYAETDDFRKWPSPEVIAHPSGLLDGPCDDYYSNGFTMYPEDPLVKLIFCSIYHHDSDLLDVRLGLTHNGCEIWTEKGAGAACKVINWVSLDPVLEPGKLGTWDCGQLYPSPNMVRLPDGTLAVPYHGSNYTHEGYCYGHYYENYSEDSSAYAWAIWDDGRLAGIEAEDYGEFWTKSFVCTGGPIEINARTKKAGSVEVELWASKSEEMREFLGVPIKAIPGYTFDECIPFRGDELWTPLQWKDKENLSQLKGQKVHLRFRLAGAKIFGYRVLTK